MLSFVGDAIVALLLVATIAYSVVLNRRLGAVRSDREKFEALVRNLNAASQRAEAAVAHLRAIADELGRRLEKKTESARALSDDLAYMIERGGAVADRLADQIRVGRDELKPDYRPENLSPKPAAASRDAHRVEPAQRPTVAARAARESAPVPQPARAAEAAPRPPFIRRDPIRVEPRVVPAETASAPVPERADAPSRAERELLRALAARRR